MQTLTEQRADTRTTVSWPVSMWLPEANRFFNCRSENISKGGAYVDVPLTAPVKKGNMVEMNFPRSTPLAQQKGQYARIKRGRVVRVERANMFKNGKLGVAVKFE